MSYSSLEHLIRDTLPGDSGQTDSTRSPADSSISVSPGTRGVIAALEDALSARDGDVRTEDIATTRAQLMRRLAELDPDEPKYVGKVKRQSSESRYRLPLSNWVALGALVISIAWGGILWHRADTPGTIANLGSHTYSTDAGQTIQVLLGDGTTVMLAPSSRLTYSDLVDSREITLTGGAHFTVSHITEKPFTVRTRQSVTKVLGTEFTVRAYPDELGESVSVESGKVSVRSTQQSDGQAIVLNSNQKANLDATSFTQIVSALPSDFNWKDGVLQFIDTPVSLAIREINRWYKTNIRIEDPGLLSMHLNATFKGENSDDIIRYLLVVLHAGMRNNGNEIVLYPVNISSSSE